jgi:hypothetical protein
VAATLDDLLEERTKEDEVAALRSTLQAAEFPVTDWEVGGVARTLVEAIGFSLADHSKAIAAIAAGGFVTLAKQLREPTWLDLLAEQIYGVARKRATYTKQRCVLSCTPGLGPVTINPGFIVQSSKGFRYIYQGAPAPVPDGSTAPFSFTAESPGSKYRDQAGTIAIIVTPLPGLAVSNPNTAFGGTVGSVATRNPANKGSGAIEPSHATIPGRDREYLVRITASGSQPASGAFAIDIYEGGVKSTIGPITPIPATYLISDDAVTLTFTNGSGVGFVLGDEHAFTTPGSPLLAVGVDDETNERLAERCLARWPSLSQNITTEKYEAFIGQCSDDNAFGIEKVAIAPSAVIAGQTSILVATAAGSPGPTVISTLQAYLNARDGITDTAIVTSATNEDVEIAGSVYVKLDELDAAKAAADEAWRIYIEALPIGGDKALGGGGVVRVYELIQVLMDAGAVTVDAIDIGAGPNVDKPMNSNWVAVIPAGEEPSTALTWIPV